MTKKEFKEIMQVLPKASKEKLRPILQGVSFKGNEVVALDGYRLSKRLLKADLNIECVINSTDLKEVVKACKRDIEQVEIIFNDNAMINLYDAEKKIVNTFECKLLEGRFITYRSLMPNYFNGTVELEVKKILDIIKPFKKNNHIALEFIEEKIKVYQIGYKGDKYDRKTVLNEVGSIELRKKVQKELLIAVNVIYLIEALKGHDEVKINYIDKISPIVIESQNKYDMILPIRLINVEKLVA